jgi:hypothetical protein
MRVGPIRLTSTARSMGESKLTVAAEWMTMSQPPAARAPASVEAEAVGAHVALDDLHPAGHQLVERGLAAELVAQAVEAVVLEDLASGALLDVAHASGADQQHELAVGHRTQEALHQRGAQEAGAAGDGDALARRGRRRSRADVYQMVESCASMRG